MSVLVPVPEIDDWLQSHSFPPAAHTKATTSYWRGSARQVMDQVLEQTKGEPAAARLKAIDAAYPFGEREQWLYKCWLRERDITRAALGLPKRRRLKAQ